MDQQKVVTRFAVSPTGFMHIGGVRTALYSYLWARKNSGTFILRIEDTDKKREESGAVAHIIESLRWLGIEWDYGPDKPHPKWGSAVQSERLDLYKSYGQKLIERGFAYPDPYTAEELQSFRDAAAAEGRQFLYRNHRPETFEEWDGTKPLRLKVPEIKRYTWTDEVRGELSAGTEMLDDIVLIKSDGFPTYNFCHIVDDYEMGVTDVMRSDEFISSMPRFLSIHDALGIPYPKFYSLPPIMGPSGKKKLSKRDGAKDVMDYKGDGYLASSIVNFLALIGWHPKGDQELYFTETELVSAFDTTQIQKSGGAFNEEKLKWMNKEHVAQLTNEKRVKYVQAALPERDAATVAKLTPTILERMHNQAEIKAADQAGEYDWAFGDITYDTNLLTWKNDHQAADALPRLQKTADLLAEADFTSPENIKATLWDYASEVGRGEVLWPLRVALSGRAQSPDPFTCAHVLGQTQTIERIKTACDKI